MSRPRLLDLFCGAGGAGTGFSRAGFDVVGVDIVPQPHYPFDFHQADAFLYLDAFLGAVRFDAIHASPPCQAYSCATSDKARHPDLYVQTRERLEASGLPWVIENVPGSPFRSGVQLCGSMFGLRVRRHRNFESNLMMFAPQCDHATQGEVLGVYGDGGPGKSTRPSGGGGTKAPRAMWAELMGMPWSDWRGARQAIPPCYTEFIGSQLIASLEAVA